MRSVPKKKPSIHLEKNQLLAELKNQKPSSAYLVSCGPVEQFLDIVRGAVWKETPPA